MKKYAHLALLGAALLAPAAAFAAQSGECQRLGHYEYHWVRHYPRAPFLGAKRIWVPDKAGNENCSYISMMKGSPEAASCLKEMRSTASPPRFPTI